MLPLDWDRVNRQMRTNRKVRVPDEEHGTALCGLHWTIPRFGQTKGAVKGTAFLWNDSDSSRPSRQRRAVTSHIASVERTNKN